MTEQPVEKIYSLLNFIGYMFGGEDEIAFSFGSLFTIVGDSLLTTFLLLFIASWVLSICLNLSKKGGK